MSNDAEKALMILADPIRWRWSDQSGNAGGWHGRTEATQYQLIPPVAVPGDAEATPANLSWRLVLWLFDKSEDHGTWVSSVEQGKAVCVRHAITDSLGEVDTLTAQMIEQMQQFLQKHPEN